jgi:hypothetical protein
MAAFDLNSLYFLKNAAPKTTSFEEAVAPIKTGFDLGTAYNENYNRNSLQNLIAQRESEGVPFDRLSNEAAKYDLNAANAMRGERRASLDYNYKQGIAEFENWRKNMARRICGLILQKSDELGMAPDQQYGVLDTAAHYVVTYDPELAEFLMQQANTRRYNAARTAPKEKPSSYKNLWAAAQQARNLAETYDQRLQAGKYWGLRNYAAAAEAVAERESRTGKVAEYNDVLRLLSNFKNRDKEIDPQSMLDYALSDKFSLINEGGNMYANEDISGIVSPYTEGQTMQGAVTPASVPSSSRNRNPVSTNRNESTDGDFKIKSMLSGIGGNPYIDSVKLRAAIDFSDNIEDNQKALKFLENVKLQLTEDSAAANKGAAKTEGADKNYFDLVNSKIDERKNLLKGGISPKSARILKLNGKTAGETTAARAEWSRISNLPELYYVNPGAILPALQRALLPEERTTDEDVKRSVLSGAGVDNSMIDRIVNAFSMSNGGTFATMMKDKSYATAARALAPYVMGVMIKKYDNLVKMTGNEKDVDDALKETYNIGEDVLEYLKGNKILYTEKDLYEREAEKRQRARSSSERNKYRQEQKENSANEVNSNGGATGETLAEKIARRRRERNGGK